MRFLWRRAHRFYKRELRALGSLIRAYSEPAFAEGLGRHAETMFDAALPRSGMRFLEENVRTHAGVTWQKTGHDLDRLYELDGVVYGVEIKNKLQYIDEEEFEAKLAKRVREATGLPVDAPRAIYDGTLQRLQRWHAATRGLGPNQIRVAGAVVTLGQPA